MTRPPKRAAKRPKPGRKAKRTVEHVLTLGFARPAKSYDDEIAEAVAAEREACAKLCDLEREQIRDGNAPIPSSNMRYALRWAADQIRSRSPAPPPAREKADEVTLMLPREFAERCFTMLCESSVGAGWLFDLQALQRALSAALSAPSVPAREATERWCREPDCKRLHCSDCGRHPGVPWQPLIGVVCPNRIHATAEPLVSLDARKALIRDLARRHGLVVSEDGLSAEAPEKEPT